jgi:hypothetical protein
MEKYEAQGMLYTMYIQGRITADEYEKLLDFISAKHNIINDLKQENIVLKRKLM